MKRGSTTIIPYDDIDYELKTLIKLINNIEGIETVECCCGHGEAPCQIWFEADSIEDVTQFIHKYLYRNNLWRITIDITDIDIDENRWNNPSYLLETTCNDYYYTGVCIDNLCYKMGEVKIMTLEQAVNNIDKDLNNMMEDDTRSFYSNRESADAKYYDGIHAAIKVFERYLSEVKPGKWIETKNGTSKCSVCNEIFLAGYNYCPWCGSKMEK